MKRRTTLRALEGVALALGAPLGWLLIQAARGVPVHVALTDHPGLYVYMLAGTALAFGLFGWVLGGRESRLQDTVRRLAELAVTDGLTGLRNARYFHTRLAEEYAEIERTGRPLAVVVLDLDHFKRVNDRFGHPVGDDVLVNTARAIAAATRHGETEARVGGEEFALLLPGSTGAEAMEVAERVRRAIAENETPLPHQGGERVRVTASAGVASTAELPGVGAQELVRLADEALYRAKREGRNRSVMAAAAD
ncbi:MAG TPA: GGDEF domain-containing protein [Longimicrobiaceae bacterium]|nr:GGDEF domain-containing protein [Longimicrobiaceae bacterium]